jgi:hypothetical protein
LIAWCRTVIRHAVMVVAAPPDVDHPPGGRPLTGGPPKSARHLCDHLAGLG